MKVYEKAPTQIKIFGFDWSEELGSDTLASSEWSLTGGSASKDSDSETTTATQIVISGGAVGDLAIATNTIVTSNSETWTKSFAVRIRSQ